MMVIDAGVHVWQPEAPECRLRVPVLVQNQPGAGVIAERAVANAPAAGNNTAIGVSLFKEPGTWTAKRGAFYRTARRLF